MKILVTGVTAKQIGSERAFQIALNSGSLVQTLQAGGHEVDWRGVVPGEDLSGYDKVIVYLGPPNALGSQYTYGMLWALATRPDADYALDDWQVKQIAYGARTILKKGPQELFKTAVSRRHRDEALPHIDLLYQTLHELVGESKWDRTCYTPMFRKGNPERLGFKKVAKHVVFDPTILWLDRYSKIVNDNGWLEGPETRERRWIHAALVNKDPWLKKQAFGWPILAFAKDDGKPLPANIIRHDRVPEVELLKFVASSAGLISAAHNDAGSGWWRVRFPLAAACGAVVFGDNKELNVVYGSGNYPRFLGEIERANQEQLAEMARKQKDALLAQSMSTDELTHVINSSLT